MHWAGVPAGSRSQTLITLSAVCDHQGIGDPSHAKNVPVSCMVMLSMIFRSCSAPCWTGKRTFTILWNGLVKPVSHVPGCRAMHATEFFFLANSMLAHFVS